MSGLARQTGCCFSASPCKHAPLCLCINLQELLAIQQSDGPKNLGFFGTRNMGMTHQKLVEILSYAMVSTVRRLHTGCAVSSTAHRLGRLLRSRRLP